MYFFTWIITYFVLPFLILLFLVRISSKKLPIVSWILSLLPMLYSIYIFVLASVENVSGKMGYVVGIHSFIYLLVSIVLLFFARQFTKTK